MTNRFLLFCCVLALMTRLLPAQNDFAFEYDSNGNRVNRHVVTLKNMQSTDTTDNEGVSVIASEVVFMVFPNPTTGEVTISSSESIENGKVLVYDLARKIIKNENYSGTELHVDFSAQHPGQYLMILQTATEKKEFTITKE